MSNLLVLLNGGWLAGLKDGDRAMSRILIAIRFPDRNCLTTETRTILIE